MLLTASIPIFNSDYEGTLNLHNYIFDNIRNYIGGRTLLIGDKINVLASIFLGQNMPIHLNNYLEIAETALHKDISQNSLVRMNHKLNLSSPNFIEENSNTRGAFNALILLDCLRPSDQQQTILKSAKSLLTHGGYLVLTMPPLTAAFEYGQLTPEDWKIFDRLPLKRLLATFEIQKKRYFYIAKQFPYVMVIAKKTEANL